jgi:hypothetical protein
MDPIPGASTDRECIVAVQRSTRTLLDGHLGRYEVALAPERLSTPMCRI